MERSARQALSCPSRICPGRDNFGGSHGCREPPHSAFGAAQDRMDETVVSVGDADVEAETIVDFDASGVVQKMLPVRGRQMRWSSVQSSRTRRKLRSSVEKDGDHGAEIAPPGFESSGATQSGVAVCVVTSLKKVTIVSWKVFASLSGLTQTDVAVVTAVFVLSPRLRGMKAKTQRGRYPKVSARGKYKDRELDTDARGNP